MQAYALQKYFGLDTIDANLALGLPSDARDLSVVAAILKCLGVRRVENLLSSNPEKARALEVAGIEIGERVPTGVFVTESNRDYLETKRLRCGPPSIRINLGRGSNGARTSRTDQRNRRTSKWIVRRDCRL